MQIVIQRGKKVPLESLPEYSIALDGFVPGPKMDNDHHRYSFDHHEGCDRFSTLASCMQAMNAINIGLDPSSYTVFANDVDLDVCLSIWCLQNPDRCTDASVIKLVNAAGLLDMYCGAISVNGMSKVIEWISDPEVNSKKNDDYSKMSNDGLHSIMEAVLHRIDLYVDGSATEEINKYSKHKHTDFKIQRNENGWVLVETADTHCYSQLYKAGFERVVLYKTQNDGSLAVSIAKKSDFVENFPVLTILHKLNEIEPGWGGGTTVGGAPRCSDGSRSKLSLDKIIEVIDSCLTKPA